MGVDILIVGGSGFVSGTLARPLSQKPAVYRAVEEVVERFNQKLPRHETIKRFKILEHDFTQESGDSRVVMIPFQREQNEGTPGKESSDQKSNRKFNSVKWRLEDRVALLAGLA